MLNYTVGATLKRLANNGLLFVLAANMFKWYTVMKTMLQKVGNKLFSLGSHETESKTSF
ncbi:MAG: hypothetical protein M9916_05460 [Crocinitomicaceae bacterium]|nr:hypothetical protein [Crocinitomicaceae bacterium]